MGSRWPDFLIAGSPRCGTSWLYYLLDKHPEVYMAKPIRPEPKFFLIDELYQRGLEYYCRTWFSGVDDHQIAGEKSTNYLENAAAAHRIHQQLPGIKLIFILRDPVERAFSNYLWSQMNGLEQEDFATALSLEEQRDRDGNERFRYSRPYAYFSRGLYADHLHVYFDLFARERILILRYEDIIEEPESFALKVYRFLNVNPQPEDVKTLGVINPSVRTGQVMDSNVRNRLLEAYAEPNRRLAQFVGCDFKLWGIGNE